MNFFKLTCQTALKNESIIKIIKITSPQSRFFQTSQNLLLSQGGASKSRSPGSEIIRLYDQNGKVIGHKTKQDAETIAKKNGFSLVPMEILGKPKYPEYQMKPRHDVFSFDDEIKESVEPDKEKSTDNQAGKESKKTPTVKKDIKRITFETCIASNDLKVKMDQINRWIAKDKEVHLTIVGSRSVPIESFSTEISAMFSKDTRFLLNKQKGNHLKMIVDKKQTKSISTDPCESSQDTDSPTNRESDSPVDELASDEYLLSNEAELEKFLKKTKKLK